MFIYSSGKFLPFLDLNQMFFLAWPKKSNSNNLKMYLFLMNHAHWPTFIYYFYFQSYILQLAKDVPSSWDRNS